MNTVNEEEMKTQFAAFADLQAEKDEEILDLKDKLEKEKERILHLEKDIVDLREELTLAQNRET